MRVPIFECVRAALSLVIFSTAASAQTESLAPPPPPPSPAEFEKTEGDIAALVPLMLYQLQYSHHRFDAEISSKFLDRYLDSLDHYHSYFLQSDLDQFEKYRTNLQSLTIHHDISPANVIFSRFIQRVTERTAYVTNLLHTEQFVFTNHDRFIPDRHTLPNPTDVTAAHDLWRQELRYEFLDEKLKEGNMAVSGPAVFDAQSNLVITLPADFTEPTAPTNLVARTVPSLFPAKFLDAQGHEFGSLMADSTNVMVHLHLPAADTLRKVTNNFYAADGTRLGDITFTHVAVETNDGAATDDLVKIHGTETNTASTPAAEHATKLNAVLELNHKDNIGIARTLAKRYTGMLHNYNELTNDDYVLEGYLTALTHAYDPHSDYMGHASTENFNIQMHLSLSGIGARLKSEDGVCKIDELVPEGPAAKSGQITNEDTITAVAQKGQEAVEVTGMPLLKVVEMIRGAKGTPVTLTVLKAHPTDPSKRQANLTLVRDVIKLEDQAAKAKLFETPNSSSAPPTKIGVIDLPSFYAETPEPDVPGEPHHEAGSTSIDVAKLITRLEKENTDGLILDLRRNGGGFLEEALRLTGLFEQGPVVQTKSPMEGPGHGGMIDTDSTPPNMPILYKGPLIVLISRFSASASEIVAGALQDYDRALIVGDKSTFGKGTVQTLQSLNDIMMARGSAPSYDPGSIKITIKKFYRAGGASTQSNGVASDIVLPSLLNYADVGESALANPMPWDEVSSANPPNLNMVRPYLPELLKRSEQRRATDKDFAYLQEDINEYRKSLADKSLSLNEADRLAENHTTEAKMEARRKERAGRPKSGEKVYELTLKNINDAALQPFDTKPKSKIAVTDDDADAEETAANDPSANDPALTEARRILTDYIELTKKHANDAALNAHQ